LEELPEKDWGKSEELAEDKELPSKD